MFLKLLNCQEEETDAKKRIASGSQEQNTRAENDQGQDGDHSANKGKAQTSVNQFYKKQEREEVFIYDEMSRVKEKIKQNFGNVKKRYITDSCSMLQILV
jgi:hypothetical protein